MDMEPDEQVYADDGMGGEPGAIPLEVLHSSQGELLGRQAIVGASLAAAMRGSSTTALDEQLERAEERGMEESNLAARIIHIRDKIFGHYCAPGQFGLQQGAFVALMARWNGDMGRSKAEREFEELSFGVNELSVSGLRVWVTKNFGAFHPWVCDRALKELTGTKPASSTHSLLLRSWAMQIFIMSCEGQRCCADVVQMSCEGQNNREIMVRRPSMSCEGQNDSFEQDQLDNMVSLYLKKVVPNTRDTPTTKAKLLDAHKSFQAAIAKQPSSAAGLPQEQFVEWVLAAWTGHDIIMIAQHACRGSLQEGRDEEDSTSLMQGVKAVQRQATRGKAAEDQRVAARKLGDILKSKLSTRVPQDCEQHESDNSTPSNGSTPREPESPRLFPGVAMDTILEELGLEQALQDQVRTSQYSVWRSLKARKMVVEMVSLASEQLGALLLRFEHQYRLLLSQHMVMFPEGKLKLPPDPGEARRIAEAVLPQAWQDAGVEAFYGLLYEQLLSQFLTRVKADAYAKNDLRQQMQELVTTAADQITAEVAEAGVIHLKAHVENKLGMG